MTASPERLQFFRSLSERAVSRGAHPHTPFWDGAAARFLPHPTVMRLVARVGRGGVKSTTALDFALTEMVGVDWKVPVGETHYFAWVSENLDEAAQRPRQIEARLNAMGIPCQRAGNTVTIDGFGIGFKSFACRVGAVSGFRCIGFVADELAKWNADDDAADPASEVLASLRAMCVTHPEAREFLISSPFGELDEHARLFADGDTDAQLTFYAPTWVANPSVTEQQTRDREPNPSIWSREYLAVPGQTVSVAFDVTDALACFGRVPSGTRGMGFLTTDASSLREQDDFAFMAGYQTTRGEVVVTEIGGWSGAEQRTVTLSDIAQILATKATQVGAWAVLGDQRESAGLQACLGDVGCDFRFYDWSLGSKDEAIQLLRRLMREGKLMLPEHPRLRRELTTLRARLLQSGATKYETNGFDYASCLVTLAHAMLEGDAPAEAPDLSVAGVDLATIMRVTAERGRL
ncbi:MAG TPA: hypothetical protein VHC69_31595 [Polyangiaceae bacterium]|nr:hypothetical protein [Polyangiaceae bacterium]